MAQRAPIKPRIATVRDSLGVIALLLGTGPHARNQSTEGTSDQIQTKQITPDGFENGAKVTTFSRPPARCSAPLAYARYGMRVCCFSRNVFCPVHLSPMNQQIQGNPLNGSRINKLKINGSRFVELVLFRAYAELTAEAARFSLGVLWWLVEPILYVGVFYLIFGIIFQRGGEGFVFSLLTGLLTWRWFDASVRGGATSIQGNGALIRQIAIPKLVFPIVVLLVNLAKFCIVFSIFLLFLILVHGAPTSRWLALPLLLAIQLLFTAGVSFMIAAWVPFFPDLIMINNQLLTLWFFLSGIFFDISNIDAKLRSLLSLNPMAVIIDSYRAVLLHDSWPDWVAIGKVAAISMAIILVALLFYRKFDHTYPKLVY